MRIAAALFAFLFAGAAVAVAGPMMPPGPSPDSGLKGVWRIIAANPAPWAPQRKLTKTDAPLLEFAVEFEDDAVKGPAPLGCNAARYSSGETYRDELFGGRVKTDQAAQALKLTQPPTTFRVICGTAARDFYIDDSSDLKMAQGDVIYTLERPTGMDPEQYTAGFSGPSFDCSKAKTTGERLICSDAGLSKSDTQLAAKYLAIKKTVSPESFATFQTGERGWLAYMMKACGANVPWPDLAADRTPIIDCMSQMTDDRADVLDGARSVKTGALTLEPRMRFHTRDNPPTEESDIYPLMSGGPQAAAFNAYVAKLLKLNAWRMDDKTLFRYGDDINEGATLHAHRFYSVLRFDSHVISLWFGTSDFTGGHDEERNGFALNWDLAKAKPIALADVLRGNWPPFVLNYSTKNLAAQAKDQQAPADLSVSDLKKQLLDNANWSWEKDKAVVTFTIFMDSGQPEQAWDVDLPYKMLKPYLKPDSPVLAQ